MLIAKTLTFYKQTAVQELIVAAAKNKEVSVRYTDFFGKRPEAIFTDGDVLDFAKNKASSFHASEELWSNPLRITTPMSRKDVSELRVGWDLVLDVDCPYWPLSKLIAHLFVKAIKAHGIKGVTVKYSGNKGFHIAVPFESFPERINNEPTKDLFPQAPRRIAHYLLHYLSTTYLEDCGEYLVFDKRRKIKKTLLAEKLSVKDFTTTTISCSSCGWVGDSSPCPVCGLPTRTVREFNPLSIIEVDTILISHRHLYRMPYSFHEKSELVSIPVDPERILSFSKEQARPEHVRFDIPFLNRDVRAGEASSLFIAAYDWKPYLEVDDEGRKEFEMPSEALPKESFPPCIQLMLQGLKDGRKRALFTLINFLRGCGWGHEAIEHELEEWNARNDEQLREVELKGRLRYERTKKDPLPPHNCKRYYQDFNVCRPDPLCATIKNPLQYAMKKARSMGVGKQARVKLTSEQKEARRQFREQKKDDTL